MLKEVFEQPRVLEDVFRGRIDFQNYSLHSDTLAHIATLGIKRVNIVASGTSYHAGLLREILSRRTREYPCGCHCLYRVQIQEKICYNGWTLYLVLSIRRDDRYSWFAQDREGTMRTCIRSSECTRFCDRRAAGQWLFTRAGTEVGVASTKAFVTQVACFLFLALYLGQKNGLDYRGLERSLIRFLVFQKLSHEFSSRTKQFERLQRNMLIPRISSIWVVLMNSWSLWRGHSNSRNLLISTLKHIHQESSNMDRSHLLMLSSHHSWSMVEEYSLRKMPLRREIRARGGSVVWIIAKNDPNKQVYADVIEFDPLISELNPFLEVVILQLFAYHIANSLRIWEMWTSREISRRVWQWNKYIKMKKPHSRVGLFWLGVR